MALNSFLLLDRAPPVNSQASASFSVSPLVTPIEVAMATVWIFPGASLATDLMPVPDAVEPTKQIFPSRDPDLSKIIICA